MRLGSEGESTYSHIRGTLHRRYYYVPLGIVCNWTMPVPDARMEPKRKSPSEMKSNKWCITYWLTDGRTIDALNELVKNMPENWSLEGQIEQGLDSQQKLHAQLFLKTERTRGTKIIKYFPNCYIDEAKNPFALQKYVHKEDTRVAEFKTIENRSPSWPLVRDKFFDWLIETEPFYSHIKDDMDERVSPRLEYWDKFITLSVAEGMNVELVGVNPQYRSAIRRYWSGFITRAECRLSHTTSADKRTDGQIFENASPPPSIKLVAEGGSLSRQNSRIVIPTI